MQLLLGRITLSWTKTWLSKAIVQRKERDLWCGICTGYCLRVSGIPLEFFPPSRAESGLKLMRYPNTIEACLKLTFSLRDPSPWEGAICCFYCLLVPQKHTPKLYQAKEGGNFPWASMQQWEETGSVTQDLAQDFGSTWSPSDATHGFCMTLVTSVVWFTCSQKQGQRKTMIAHLSVWVKILCKNG